MLVHALAPDGCGKGITFAPFHSLTEPMHEPSPFIPSRRSIASPPTGTISCGRRISSSQSRQNAQSSCSRGVGLRSPRVESRPGKHRVTDAQ